MFDKKPRPRVLVNLVNLLPGLLVLTTAVAALNFNQPVLRDIPERLSIDAQAAETPEESEAAQESVQGNFTDGVYRGSGTGYGGTITVDVTVEGGNIVDVTIVKADGETASFFKRAKGVIDEVIASQSWEVDVVSGASYSSRGILAAIQNALTGEKVETETAKAVETEKLVKEAFEEPAGGYTDGVYTGSARGFGGTISVKVTIKDGKIADITVTSASGETASYYNKAKAVISRILAKQSPNVDTVSGATYSSTGIINAVKSALKKAGGSSADLNVTETSAQETTQHKTTETVPAVVSADGFKDGVYYGTAEGFGGDVTVCVTVSDGKITAVDIVSAEDETPQFFAKAKAVTGYIVNAQSTAVDTVSGATYSSRGIINAAAKALAQAVLEGSSESTAADETTTASESEQETTATGSDSGNTPAVTYKDGVYYGTAEGFGGDVVVCVTVSDGRITSVEVTEAEDETPSFLKKAMAVTSSIVSAQSTAVDTVSGATYSSTGIINAVNNALSGASAGSGESTETESSDAAESSKQESSESVESSKQESSEAAESSKEETSEAAESSKQESSEAAESSKEETSGAAESSEEETSGSGSGSGVTYFLDGTYIGEALCTDDIQFEYTVKVTVTISDGTVSSVSIDKENDNSDNPDSNDSFLDYAIDGRTRRGVTYTGLEEQILNKQSTDAGDYDTVSGATYSSKAIAGAAASALSSANSTVTKNAAARSAVNSTAAETNAAVAMADTLNTK